jgi:hypothetical protein
MAKSKGPTTAPDMEDYPPTSHLNPTHLKSMGHKGTPKIGDMIPMHGRVTGVNEHPDGGHSVSVELQKMAAAATKRASQEDVEEGKLSGAKAAMDQALDAQEMSKGANAKHGKAVGRKS